MTNNGIVNIHGREYMTVARRLELAHVDGALESVETEILSHAPVVIRATIQVKGKTFTGISAVNLDSGKMIERANPYEVAETSAVGRALGFAGFGVIESVASADEMQRALGPKIETKSVEGHHKCMVCGAPAEERRGVTKSGISYHGIFCSTGNRSHTRWLNKTSNALTS